MWVEGDNEDDNNNSKTFGEIPIALVDSKVTYKVNRISYKYHFKSV